MRGDDLQCWERSMTERKFQRCKNETSVAAFGLKSPQFYKKLVKSFILTSAETWTLFFGRLKSRGRPSRSCQFNSLLACLQTRADFINYY